MVRKNPAGEYGTHGKGNERDEINSSLGICLVVFFTPAKKYSCCILNSYFRVGRIISKGNDQLSRPFFSPVFSHITLVLHPMPSLTLLTSLLSVLCADSYFSTSSWLSLTLPLTKDDGGTRSFVHDVFVSLSVFGRDGLTGVRHVDGSSLIS